MMMCPNQKIIKSGSSNSLGEHRDREDKDGVTLKKKKKLVGTPTKETSPSSGKVSPHRNHPGSATKPRPSSPGGSSHSGVPLKKKKKVCNCDLGVSSFIMMVVVV